MTKAEMVKMVASEESITQASTGRVIDAVFRLITEALEEDGRVELGGFGVFRVVTRRACSRPNPQDRTKIVHTPERNTVKFRPNPRLKRGVNRL